MVPSKGNVTERSMPNRRTSINERFKYLDIQYDHYKEKAAPVTFSFDWTRAAGARVCRRLGQSSPMPILWRIK